MPLERLGESRAFGEALLGLLGQEWEFVETTAFAGGEVDDDGAPLDGDRPAVLVIASRNGYEIKRTGPTFTAAARAVFDEAVKMWRPRGDAQLQLELAIDDIELTGA